MEILQMSAGDLMSFDAPGGRVIFNANCTGGLAKITWPSEYTDNSNGAVTIIYIHPDAIHQGTLRAGGDGISNIQLAADAPGAVSGMDPCIVKLSKGTIIQEEVGNQYDPTSKVLSLRRDLKSTVDSTWQYEIFRSIGFGHLNDGQTQAGGTGRDIILNTLASTVTDVYKGNKFVITSDGTLSDFAANIVASVDNGSGNCKITIDRDPPIDIGAGVHYELRSVGDYIAEKIPTDITYNIDGTINVITFADGDTWTHVYTGGILTSITVG
jgi:hypothetical protein